MQGFISTRGSDQATLEAALFRGLARDGGLYVPARLIGLRHTQPPSTDLLDVARWVAASLFPELPRSLVDGVVTDALSFPIPLVPVEPGVHVLELFHGPTHAFKDVGARFLAGLASHLNPGGPTRTVLVATSGDTGGAVAAAFHGRPGFRVVVLFPEEGVSERQRRQMTTLGGNVTALAVGGSFDDCQRMTKEAFVEADLREGFMLTSANSINVGRLLPQAIYYVYAAALLGWGDRPVRFVVPSGNLGNLCAGLLARRMGMPTSGFLAATNVNRSFVDFVAGLPERMRPTIRTDSSAMDVGHPSNLERISWLYGGEIQALRADVAAVSITDEDARSGMRALYERAGYVLDPHGAVAYEAVRRQGTNAAGPAVVLATAHPAKFPEVTEAVCGIGVPLPAGMAGAESSEEHMRRVAPTLEALRQVLEEVAD